MSVGQSRAVPTAAWVRTIAMTCSTVSSGLENECPQRPFNWRSQNAGAIHSSSDLISALPEAGRTSAMRSCRSATLTQQELR